MFCGNRMVLKVVSVKLGKILIKYS